MNYRTLIADAWKYTQKNKKLIFWYGFIPSIFSTGATIIYALYQFFAMKSSPLFDNAEHSFLYDLVTTTVDILKNSGGLLVPIIIAAIIIGIIYLLLPTLCQGAAIQLIARHRNGQPLSVGGALKYGFMSFLKLFEYHLLIKSFGLLAILGEMAFVLRNLGLESFKLFLPIFAIIFVIGLALTLLFTFADLFIVVEDEGVIASIKRSVKMVVMNMQHTFLITVLMMIIGARIILQIVIVLLIPGAIIVAGGYFAASALAPIITFGLAGVIGFIALMVAAYLGGVVNIFAYAVWTYAFLDLVEKEELGARDKIAFEQK